MPLNTTRTLSRLTWSTLAAVGSLALLLVPQSGFADNMAAAPAAPAASPAKPAAAAPATKAPVKKKAMAKMAKKHPVKSGYKGLSFTGTVVATDLSASPQTVVVSTGKGKKENVFGGALTAHTLILKGHKHVKASSIQQGDKVVVQYKKAMGTLIVTKIWVH
ncbi:MAG: hypothetical protein ACYCYP_10145 [Leptospirales bacterium]